MPRTGNLGQFRSSRIFEASLHASGLYILTKLLKTSTSISHDSSFSVHSGKSTADKTFFWPWLMHLE